MYYLIKMYHLLYAFIGIPPQHTFSKPSFLISICQISGGESKVLPFNPGGQPLCGKIIITSLKRIHGMVYICIYIYIYPYLHFN